MPNPLILGNWKMNGDRRSCSTLLQDLFSRLPMDSHVEVGICPPSIYLHQTYEMLKFRPAVLGAQNLSQFADGAYTGEVSASMLNDMEVKYVLVGHSERRTLFGEDDQIVSEKYYAALKAGLTPVLCVGEDLKQRESEKVYEVIASQINTVTDRVGIEGIARGVIAYEPVWAIGTGLTATPQQAQQVHHFIRTLLTELDPELAAGLRILYGGSLKPETAEELFKQPDINGGLVGGAALDAGAFAQICITAGECYDAN